MASGIKTLSMSGIWFTQAVIGASSQHNGILHKLLLYLRGLGLTKQLGDNSPSCLTIAAPTGLGLAERNKWGRSVSWNYLSNHTR